MTSGYIWRLLRAGERLLNALAAGNDFCTISGRFGHLASHAKNPLWRGYARIIDWAFSPVEPGHCQQAWRWELGLLARGYSYNQGSDIARAVLGLILIFCCPGIRVVAQIHRFFTLWRIKHDNTSSQP